MPFEIIRNNITKIHVDAIVTTAYPKPMIGLGVDAAIHAAAGRELLAARKEIGKMSFGQAAVTPGFSLYAKYVIHAVKPIWYDGNRHEEELLKLTYEKVLQLALDYGCESIALPLLSAGNHGFPKTIALKIAINAFSEFLMVHEMQIQLVVFSCEALTLSERLFQSVSCYIDECDIKRQKIEEYGLVDKEQVRDAEWSLIGVGIDCESRILSDLLKQQKETFSEKLLRLIDESGKTDVEVYRSANVDRRLFSKIRTHRNYQPSKGTALAFSVALHLDRQQTDALLDCAGYSLTNSNRRDLIIAYCIDQKKYNIFEINELLFEFDEALIGC